MSRSWSVRCYRTALRFGSFAEELDKSAGPYGAFVKVAPEREKILCKKWACKHRVGMRSAPAQWVRDVLETPFRQAQRRLLGRIRRGCVDVDAATFPVYRRQAWWRWS